jgi:uncharacterized coiled-coil DUF342 family protein
MSSAVAGAVAEQLVSKALDEAVSRIVKKLAQGKKLTDSEIAILYMNQVLKRVDAVDKRIDDLRTYVDKKFEEVDKRFDDLKSYIDKRFEEVNKRFDDLKSYVDKRLDDLRSYVDKRFEDFKSFADARFDSVEKRISGLEKRIDLVYNEVSSIKTDIIKIMRELLERAYGAKTEAKTQQ